MEEQDALENLEFHCMALEQTCKDLKEALLKLGENFKELKEGLDKYI